MKISTEIKKISLVNDIVVEKLPDEEALTIKRSITQKYVYPQPESFLWNRLKEAAVKRDNNGWQKMCSFVGNSKCLMFFDDIEDRSVLVINNGKSLYKLLDEMFGFEFYITDFETDYLLCFNHHDCLLGCGTAKRWVNSL